MLLLSGRVIALGVCLANLAYGELTVEIKARIEERDSGHTMVLDVKNTGVRPVHLVYEDLPWNDFNGALALRAVGTSAACRGRRLRRSIPSWLLDYMAGDPEIQPRDSISGELTLNYVLDDLEKVLGNVI